jgi:hypothetical protein
MRNAIQTKSGPRGWARGSLLVAGVGLLALTLGCDPRPEPPRNPLPPCGGFAGLACPADLRCVDDPGDSCDPNHGGADCGGICVSGNPICDIRYTDPDRRYIAHSERLCSAIRFTCKTGEQVFFEPCGCGCEKTDPAP